MEIEGYAGVAALLAPYAALLAMIAVLVTVQRRHRRGGGREATATGRYGAPVEPARIEPAQVAHRTPADGANERRDTATPSRHPSPPEARSSPPAARPAAPMPKPKQPLPAIEAVLAEIGRAEAAGDERRLAELSVTAAEVHLGAGGTDLAAEALRRAIRIAVRLDLKAVHARARIELGDMARRAGDLTTACEHWQIARGLFHETGQGEPLEATEARMRDNGCPTDWVLNDF